MESKMILKRKRSDDQILKDSNSNSNPNPNTNKTRFTTSIPNLSITQVRKNLQTIRVMWSKHNNENIMYPSISIQMTKENNPTKDEGSKEDIIPNLLTIEMFCYYHVKGNNKKRHSKRTTIN